MNKREAIIETSKLQMVLTKVEDFEYLYQNIFSSNEVTKYTFGKDLTKSEAKEFFLTKFCFSGNLGFSPIILKDTNCIIGYGGILEYKEYKNSYEFGYILAKQHWGKGYATQIAQAQVMFIKQKFKDATIYATAHPKNLASKRVLEKVGLKYVKTINKTRGIRDIYKEHL